MPEARAQQAAAWPPLPMGTALHLVKVAADGHEVTSYPGTVIDAGAPPPWVAVEATWTHRQYDLNGLLFIRGDTLHEFFSPVDWFNLFSIFAPDGVLRGWYANVTYPTRLDISTDPLSLAWHDLYLDVVALPDGRVFVRDEDELAASKLAETDLALYKRILGVRDDLLGRVDARTFPFHERSG